MPEWLAPNWLVFVAAKGSAEGVRAIREGFGYVETLQQYLMTRIAQLQELESYDDA